IQATVEFMLTRILATARQAVMVAAVVMPLSWEEARRGAGKMGTSLPCTCNRMARLVWWRCVGEPHHCPDAPGSYYGNAGARIGTRLSGIDPLEQRPAHGAGASAGHGDESPR